MYAVRLRKAPSTTPPAVHPLPYLDVIQDAAQPAPNHSLACYCVSDEYAIVVASARAGVYNLRTMAFETCESMVRAGCTLILTYTSQFLDWLDDCLSLGCVNKLSSEGVRHWYYTDRYNYMTYVLCGARV